MDIITWNMQGGNASTENKWNTGIMNFLSNGVNMCCLQECGAVPASAKIVNANYGGIAGLQYYTWGTLRTNKHILFYQSDPNGNRCNLAIVSDSAPLAGAVLYPAAAPVWRPALGFQVAANRFVFSLHAISPNGPDYAGLLNRIAGAVGAGNSWAAFGDYNRAPGTLAVPAGVAVCPPNNNTYPVANPASQLDYCVKNFAPQAVGVVQALVMSDHYPVRYTI
jgi:cytolethal distending toxin subunit B